jgi:hypothetical protein
MIILAGPTLIFGTGYALTQTNKMNSGRTFSRFEARPL